MAESACLVIASAVAPIDSADCHRLLRFAVSPLIAGVSVCVSSHTFFLEESVPNSMIFSFDTVPPDVC